ncbi:MAG: hypothetical protein HYZ02_00515 [Candidatus Levybacteria bacterium]|nr:hypothetical protein [Candidatus Levybacteria bacterium]MBI3092705.1 hypothetical protein [Candidatus Levybacteria bacterium]
MPISERRPFNIVNLGELLPPSVRADFEYGKIIIDGREFYLSGRIPAETRAPGWLERKKTAGILAFSGSEAARILSPVSKIVGCAPPRRPALVPLFADERLDSARVGVATRVELDSFEGRFSPSDESFLIAVLKETIGRSANERDSSKMQEETKKLVKEARTQRRNLLCLFTLGGFFACLLGREEEIGISPQAGTLVPMAKQVGLVRPTELTSLYFLLRIKQLGESRIRVLSPAEWIALVNYRDLLALRKFSSGLPPDNQGHWSMIHPGPTEKIYETGKKSPETPLAIKIPPIPQKSSGFVKKSPPRKPRRFG